LNAVDEYDPKSSKGKVTKLITRDNEVFCVRFIKKKKKRMTFVGSHHIKSHKKQKKTDDICRITSKSQKAKQKSFS